MRKRILSIMLIINFILLIPSGKLGNQTVQASTRKLELGTALSLALSESDDYVRLQNKITLAKVQYQQAVKKLKLKEEKQKSFKYSPLLNFSLPEKPNLSEAYEYQYKPLEMQSQLDQLNHQLKDIVYEIYETVELQFVEAYRLQEKIAYNEDTLDQAETTLKKNQARLLLGEATQTDVDTMQSKVTSLESTIASDQRNLEAVKEKLSDATGLDLSSGYTFSNPMVEADMEREDLEDLIEATLDRSDTYYQAELEASNARLSLNTNYSLMAAHYSTSDMSIIDPYVNQAKNGQKLDTAAFKLSYNKFLEAIDAPWQGNYKILFVSFPKSWLKGDLDGIGYVEDEPYALYEAAVEYSNALKEVEATEKEITQSVKDSFENYVSAKNAYESADDSVEAKKQELKKAKYLNQTGKMTYEEYVAVQDEYEEAQLDYLQAQADYSTILYSFNRLTCGKVSEYMDNSYLLVNAVSGGVSYVVEDEGDGIYYYIRSLVSDNVFELGLSVSEDYETDVDSYELWIDGVQVGDRTGLENTIRHLSLDTKDAGKVIIRLYAGDTFVDDCEIDPTVYTGKLTITNYQVLQNSDDDAVAYYSVTTMASGFMKLTITPKEGEKIAYYVIRNENSTALINDTKLSIDQDFKYLPAANNSLQELTISFYDSNGELLYEGTFNTSEQMIYKK